MNGGCRRYHGRGSSAPEWRSSEFSALGGCILEFKFDGTPTFVLDPLDPMLDSEYEPLYRFVLEEDTSLAPSFDSFFTGSLEFFDRAAGDAGLADEYFNRFEPLWKWLLYTNRPRDGYTIWELCLQIARD